MLGRMAKKIRTCSTIANDCKTSDGVSLEKCNGDVGGKGCFWQPR